MSFVELCRKVLFYAHPPHSFNGSRFTPGWAGHASAELYPRAMSYRPIICQNCESYEMKHLISFLFLTLPLAAMAQSPVGAASSDRANEVATNTQKPTIEYANAGQEGPRIVVAPGDIKSANASFTKKVTANAIADFGEVELNRANFKITKNQNNAKFVVKFDIVKAESLAKASEGFSGPPPPRPHQICQIQRFLRGLECFHALASHRTIGRYGRHRYRGRPDGTGLQGIVCDGCFIQSIWWRDPGHHDALLGSKGCGRNGCQAQVTALSFPGRD